MKKYCSAIFWGICFIIFTVLVKFVDVQPVGAEASLIGFANLNTAVFQLLGTNDFCYRLTQCLGIVAIATAARYAIDGFIQLIKRKSLFKVDREIISLGVLYALMLMIYVFFEKFIINYRPILLDGELEASFPSSHTILSICICVSSLIVSKKYVPKKYINITTFITVLLLTMVLLGRTISGVHWISDIVGGIIISITLLSYFITVLNWKKEK
jgi:undecaprenyl-diphosphatase